MLLISIPNQAGAFLTCEKNNWKVPEYRINIQTSLVSVPFRRSYVREPIRHRSNLLYASLTNNGERRDVHIGYKLQ